MNRGVEKRDIFLDDRDRRTFLELLEKTIDESNWNLHSYVLMRNHFHLLVETLGPTLSDGVQMLTGKYAESFNEKHRRVGHLFQGRFRAHLIDTERYLLTVARYIVLNPVRAKFVQSAADWRWSSFRATAGVAMCPQWLTARSILDRFDPHDHERARAEYRRYIGDPSAATDRPWDNLVGDFCLGGEGFIARIQTLIDERTRSHEHPKTQRMLRPATLSEVEQALLSATGERPAKSGSRSTRMMFAELARSETSEPLYAIGRSLGVGATAVSYLCARSSEAKTNDPAYVEQLESVRMQIRNCRLKT